jgi:universal stress protein A
MRVSPRGGDERYYLSSNTYHTLICGVISTPRLKMGREDGEGAEMVEKILVAVGDSEHAEDVAKLAGILARTYHAEVHVLHVWECPSSTFRVDREPLEIPAEDQRLADEVVHTLAKGRTRATGCVVACPRGGISRAIVEEAARMEPDLIVMGSRGPSTWSAFWKGSVAQWVIRHSPCPVVVAREREESRRPERRHHPAAAR